MTSRLKKASYTTIIGLGLFAGAAGIAAATSGGNTPAPTSPARSVNQDNEAGEDGGLNESNEANEAGEDGGVNCENGIDTATGGPCDGGPAANQDNDPNEPAGVEDANG